MRGVNAWVHTCRGDGSLRVRLHAWTVGWFGRLVRSGAQIVGAFCIKNPPRYGIAYSVPKPRPLDHSVRHTVTLRPTFFYRRANPADRPMFICPSTTHAKLELLSSSFLRRAPVATSEPTTAPVPAARRLGVRGVDQDLDPNAETPEPLARGGGIPRVEVGERVAPACRAPPAATLGLGAVTREGEWDVEGFRGL